MRDVTAKARVSSTKLFPAIYGESLLPERRRELLAQRCASRVVEIGKGIAFYALKVRDKEHDNFFQELPTDRLYAYLLSRKYKSK